MRNTKIVCTLGPATDKEGILRQLMENGMNVARFNFSHGSYDEHKRRLDEVKALRTELDLPVAAMLDTKGPEIRLGDFKNATEKLTAGQKFTLTTRPVEGTAEISSVTYKELPNDVQVGGRIMLDDGLIGLTIDAIEGGDIRCTVENDGVIKSKKGVNVPGVHLSMPYMSQRDRNDILFGIQQGFDGVFARFTRCAQDIQEIRHLLDENNSSMRISAKIENQEGVDNVDEILKAADGIMVARGDMGVEIPAYDVPHVQKTIVQKCNQKYKPVIVATQMLDSMIRNPRPTRAEVTDVANAIREGTDAIMLSGETAMGKYPVEALRMMVQIAESTEQYLDYDVLPDYRTLRGDANVSNAVGVAAVRTATNVQAKCIVTPTMTGQTARLMSNFRPAVPIYAVTPNEWAQRKLQLSWGVTPLKGYEEDTTEHILSHAMYVVKREGYVEEGDMVVFTAGDPATNIVKGKGTMTNMMHVIQAK